MKIFVAIENLIQYALNKNLIQKEDIVYTKNQIIECLKIEDLQEASPTNEENLENILNLYTQKTKLLNA